jgi:hypothetical protein
MLQKSIKRSCLFRKQRFVLILCCSSLLALPIQAQNLQFSRWRLQTSGPAGYASPAAMETLKKAISGCTYRRERAGPQVEEEEEKGYRPIGLSLKITGNWSSFSSGDIDTGSAGMFDQVRDYVTSLGYTVQSQKKLTFHSGYGFAGEIIYDLNPRLGIGLKVGRFHAYKQSTLQYSGAVPPSWGMGSIPDIGSTSLELELRYTLPLHRVLAVVLSGGPEIHFVKFKYARNFKLPSLEESIDQRADASGLGFQGSLGLEVSLNPRLALVLEGQGRYARITNFKGEERFYHWENFQSSDSQESGFLYFIQEGNYPGLAILPQEPSAGSAERAVFDFTGVGFSVGLRFKF